MTGYFTTVEISAQLRNVRARGKCRYEEKRGLLTELVQQDIARLICTASDTNYFSYLISKRGELALVIGTRGDFKNRVITLELIRQRQRIAYFSYSDPVLHEANLRQRQCMAARQGSRTLTVYADEGSLSDLIAMRALLYDKLPYKGRVLTLAVG